MADQQGVKITLHWLNKSRSQRILWLLEELKLQYEVKIYHRQSNQFAPPELKEVHPLGKSPVLTLVVPGKDKPVVLAESGFITEYLIDNFGPQLKPTQYESGKEGKVGGETEGWLRYRYQMHFNEGTMMPMLVVKLITLMIRKAPFFVRPITNQVASGIEDFIHPAIAANMDLVEQQLATSPDNGKFVCGPSLSGADVLLSFPVIAYKYRFGFDKKRYPNLAVYADMLEQLPGYIAAVKKIESLDGQKYEPVAM